MMMKNLLKLSLLTVWIMGAPPKAAGAEGAPQTLTEQIAHAIAPIAEAADQQITTLTAERDDARTRVFELTGQIAEKNTRIAALEALLADAGLAQMGAEQVAARDALLALIDNTAGQLDALVQNSDYWVQKRSNKHHESINYLTSCTGLANALSLYCANYHPYPAQQALSEIAINKSTAHLNGLHDLYMQDDKKIGSGSVFGLIFDSKQVIFELLDRYVRGQVVSMPGFIRSLNSLKLLGN